MTPSSAMNSSTPQWVTLPQLRLLTLNSMGYSRFISAAPGQSARRPSGGHGTEMRRRLRLIQPSLLCDWEAQQTPTGKLCRRCPFLPRQVRSQKQAGPGSVHCASPPNLLFRPSLLQWTGPASRVLCSPYWGRVARGAAMATAMLLGSDCGGRGTAEDRPCATHREPHRPIGSAPLQAYSQAPLRSDQLAEQRTGAAECAAAFVARPPPPSPLPPSPAPSPKVPSGIDATMVVRTECGHVQCSGSAGAGVRKLCTASWPVTHGAVIGSQRPFKSVLRSHQIDAETRDWQHKEWL